MTSINVNIVNRRATFEFELLDKYTAGMILSGTEIKAIRGGEVNLTDAFCVFLGGELFVKNLHIAPYAMGTGANHEAKRDRKLLLNKREIGKLETKIKEKGLALIVVKMFTNPRGIAKLEIALGRGKKLYDKRESIKERDVKRNIARGRGDEA